MQLFRPSRVKELVKTWHSVKKKKQTNKKNQKSENAQWRRLFFYQLSVISLLSFFCCLFLFYYSLFCLSVWHFPIALTYERIVAYEDGLAEQREICWYVWTGKFFFSGNRLFLFCCCLFVFTLCFNLFICFVFLWHFQILVSSCVQFLRRRSSQAKKNCGTCGRQNSIWTPDRCGSGN